MTPGIPNQIELANNLTNSISGSIGWVSVAYPVYDNTSYAGSIQDLTGVAFKVTDPTGAYSTAYPSVGQVGTIIHDYYSDVVSIDDLTQQSRVIGTNVLVHKANYINLNVNLSVVYDTTTSTISNTNSAIQSAINTYFDSIDFGTTVSFGGILKAVYSTGGVSSARISTSGDNPANYGLQSLYIDGVTVKQTYTKDILLNANQIPNLVNVNITSFGYNNY